MHKVLCSTGALITRKNGRDHRLLAGFAEQLHCDGFEFMLYDSWYDKFDSIADDVKAMGLDIPAVHCEKSIGELIAAEDDLEYERFEMNCKAAERVGAKLLAALPAHEEGAKAILIEAECPEKADDEAMAVRRLGFYARCGAVDTGWTEHLFDAWFRVLVLPAEGETLDAETANKELADCYSRVMGADKWRRYVQLYRPDGTEEKF